MTSGGRGWRGLMDRIYPWIATAAAIVMVTRIAATWPVFSDTIDEPYHLGSGVALLQSGRHVYSIQHPPLPRVVAALPLYLAGVRSADPQLGKIVDDLRGFEVGHEVLLRGKYSYWTSLILARSGMLVFPLICVLYVYLLGRYLCNRLAACIAAVMFSSDPTLLGHGAWVATDVAACAGYLAGTYHGLRLVARPTIPHALAAGIAVGLALACKFTCILVLPALGIIWLLRGRRTLCTFWKTVANGALALLTAVITLWAAYVFDYGAVDQLHVLDNSALEKLPGWLRRTPLPMPTAVAGLAVVWQHNQQGHPGYLNGEFSMKGWWWYFPEALAIKSPAALIIGIVLATLVLMCSRRRRRLRTAAILVPFAVFLLASMTARLNIGVRHVLPAIPFLYLFVAMWLARGKLIFICIGFILVVLVETPLVHPDYLSFFNAFVGGPANGEKYLLDSNVDWGQDLWRLKSWLDTNAKGRIVTARLFGNPRLRQWPADGWIIAAEGSSPQGIFAVSKNYLYDIYPSVITTDQGRKFIEPSVAWLRQRTPVARIGSSINVYDLDAP